MEEEAMGKEKRSGVRASSLWFCASTWTMCCRKDGDFFWMNSLEMLG